ncbi:MAG TPA: ATP-binding protein, partial [Chitinophagaceae bacterium]|nr:ATP-binding protein [Chitinophagaceae bacterium]
QYKDSVYGPEKFRDLQLLMAEEQEHLQEAELERTQIQNRQRLLFMALVTVALLFSALILRRGNRIKQKLNSQLQQQKSDLEKTLIKLKETQSQLIQSEKMASLGELTAGIAHEIQNPLNFVNNFSEVNTELINELTDEISQQHWEGAKSIAGSLLDNEQKILLHGKRADAIVKSMLQHSRSSGSQKEATDINALCSEYLRLAYYGMRTKDPSFHAALKTDLDPAIGTPDLNAQEIGRVIQNLLANAFYALHEKQRSAGDGYMPELCLRTQKENHSLVIGIKDNGTGIPEKLREKVFQPFFTTKPTGQGTGLGLSLSYDIIKAHGGELTLDSKEGEGTTFSIRLPLH